MFAYLKSSPAKWLKKHWKQRVHCDLFTPRGRWQLRTPYETLQHPGVCERWAFLTFRSFISTMIYIRVHVGKEVLLVRKEERGQLASWYSVCTGLTSCGRDYTLHMVSEVVKACCHPRRAQCGTLGIGAEPVFGAPWNRRVPIKGCVFMRWKGGWNEEGMWQSAVATVE